MVFSHLLALFELPSFQGEVASLRLILKRPFMGDELLRDKHLGDKQFGGKDGDIAESKGQPKIEEVVESGAMQGEEDYKKGHHTEALWEARQKLF
jgi:hypothetical protein